MKFPNWWEAPNELFKIDGHCGLVTAWAVLRYFRKRTSVPDLVEACRYTKRHGVFTVSLAAALKRHDLSVSFHSQRDTRIYIYVRTRETSFCLRLMLTLLMKLTINIFLKL